MISGKVFFIDEGHQYLDSIGSLESVSRFTEKFVPKFDTMLNSNRMCFKVAFPEMYEKAKAKYNWRNPKILKELKSMATKSENMFIEEASMNLRNIWALKGYHKSNYGTDNHDNFEIFDSGQTHCINPLDGQSYEIVKRPRGSFFDNMYIIEEAMKLRKNIVILEAIVVDKKNRRAGQIDKLFLYWTGYNYVAYILDYKTDDKIEKVSFMSGLTFKEPFNYLQDTRYNYYVLKMNTYALYLSYLGVQTQKMYLYHVPSDGKYKYIPVRNIQSLMKKAAA